jgi:hypothetical protein
MELLVKVHWVATRDGAKNADDATAWVHQGSDRKMSIFPPRHIELAWKVLEQNRLL